MSKIKLIKKKSVSCIMNERNLLAILKHPLIIKMHYAFEDRERLYIITDLLNGGDLRYHLKNKKKFNETELKFIMACSVAALEYMHSKGIIHRDIKPENLLLGEDGYISLTDMGISTVWTPENCNETSGTPGYMAPEVMSKQNHGIAVDYYGLGII
jgi:protein kinase A